VCVCGVGGVCGVGFLGGGGGGVGGGVGGVVGGGGGVRSEQGADMRDDVLRDDRYYVGTCRVGHNNDPDSESRKLHYGARYEEDDIREESLRFNPRSITTTTTCSRTEDPMQESSGGRGRGGSSGERGGNDDRVAPGSAMLTGTSRPTTSRSDAPTASISSSSLSSFSSSGSSSRRAGNWICGICKCKQTQHQLVCPTCGIPNPDLAL